MTENMRPDPGYTFRKPPEWDGLVACAEDAITPGQPKAVQNKVVSALWRALPDIAIEQQEVNRYYGLGLVGCKVVKSCFLPADEPGSIIRLAVDNLVSAHWKYGNDSALNPLGLRLNEVVASNLLSGPCHETDSAYPELSLAERITIDTLQACAVDKNTWKSRFKSQDRKAILGEDRALSNIRDNIFTGACRLFRTAAEKKFESNRGILAGIFGDGETSYYRIQDMLNDQEIRDLCPPATATQAARMHSSVFLQHLPEFVYMGDNNTAQVNTPPITRKSTADSLFPRHEQAIGCPLLYVSGAIAYVTPALPEIIIRSQERILNRPDQQPC